MKHTFIYYGTLPIIFIISTITFLLTDIEKYGDLVSIILFAVFFIYTIIAEKIAPYKKEYSGTLSDWKGDGAIFLVAQPFVEFFKYISIIIAGSLVASSEQINSFSTGMFILDLVLAILITDLILYAGHRFMHEGPKWAWNFHALHHLPKKLYSGNFLGFHPVNLFTNITLALLPLYLMGFSAEVIIITTFIKNLFALLSHSNIDMSWFGLSHFLNTAENHRWHHSINLAEGDKNYSPITMLWDIVFRTFYFKKGSSPEKMGIKQQITRLDGFIYPLGYFRKCRLCSALFNIRS